MSSTEGYVYIPNVNLNKECRSSLLKACALLMELMNSAHELDQCTLLSAQADSKLTVKEFMTDNELLSIYNNKINYYKHSMKN